MEDSDPKRFPYRKTALLSFGVFASNIAWSVFIIYVPLFIRRAFLNTYDKPEIVAQVSAGLGKSMKGLEISKLETKMQDRGK